MMDFIYSLMVLVHILLLVFWVGTDVGVFLAAKVSERTDLSIETRSTVLSVGMVLDRLPRSALVLIIPSGLFLASYSGLMNISPIIFYGICFVLFRIFDILKPFPVNYFDKNYKNSFGVIMDDVCAGLYVVLSLICFMLLSSYLI